MRVSVIGCGYLGVTHAACMAELGHEVLALDVDEMRLGTLQAGRVPFHEPGLEALVRRNMSLGRLHFTESTSDVAAFADVHFLCVGTPQRHDQGADVTQVEAAVCALAPLLHRPTLVVGKSTVPVGTAASLAETLRRQSPVGAGAQLAWNPEFLREGHAVEDSMHPDRLVFGVGSESAESVLREVYRGAIGQGTPVLVMDFATSELVKSSANAFLATKISFINAIGEVCEAAGADVAKLAEAIGMDERIGHHFLRAGVGFGGGCLPKDIRAFAHRAGELGVPDAQHLLRVVDAINLGRREHVVALARSMVGDLVNARIAVLGAAFKPNSDDVRDSPALWVAGQLQLGGATVTVYDPAAMDNAYAVFPTLDYATSAIKACQDADVVLHLTEWQEFRQLQPSDLADTVAHRRIIDGRNCLRPQTWRSAGWEFRAFGRP